LIVVVDSRLSTPSSDDLVPLDFLGIS
jgi:hypothetical protein